VTWLDLHCVESYQLGFFGSLYFLGFLISCLIFPPLSDRFGRKNMFLIGAVGQAFAIAMMILYKDIHVQLTMIFLLGYTYPPKSMVAYSHLMEMIPTRECKVSGMMMFIDGMVLVISPVILLYVTKDLDHFMLIALGLNALAVFLFIALRIPESPKFLL
jgi:YNFM family putative membrane transporter